MKEKIAFLRSMALVLALVAGAWACEDGGKESEDGDTQEMLDVPVDDAADTPQDDAVDVPPDDAEDMPADVIEDDGPGPELEDIHFIGRFDLSDPASPRFEWSATAVGARFSGTGISVVLDSEGENYFEVIVDGEVQPLVHTSGGEETFTLASGLAAGEHDVMIVRRTEAFFQAVSFKEFTVEGGAIVPSPPPYAHRLEFIGNSITAGYGALGEGPDCSFSGDTESAYASYASVAARAVNAAAHLIAWSGKGVYQNYGGDTNEPMPAIYERTIPTEAGSAWDFSYQAEAVIINLGTNDFSVEVSQPAFESAYEALIELVRSRHPVAEIYCVGGDFLNTTATGYIANAIATTGDAHTQLLELPGVEASEGWGCDWHPSAATHERIGGLVAARLASDLGW